MGVMLFDTTATTATAATGDDTPQEGSLIDLWQIPEALPALKLASSRGRLSLAHSTCRRAPITMPHRRRSRAASRAGGTLLLPATGIAVGRRPAKRLTNLWLRDSRRITAKRASAATGCKFAC